MTYGAGAAQGCRAQMFNSLLEKCFTALASGRVVTTCSISQHMRWARWLRGEEGGGIYRRPRSTFHSLHFMAEGESDRTLIRGANNTFYYRTLGELGRRNQIYFLSGIRLERRRALEADKGGRKFGGPPIVGAITPAKKTLSGGGGAACRSGLSCPRREKKQTVVLLEGDSD